MKSKTFSTMSFHSKSKQMAGATILYSIDFQRETSSRMYGNVLN